MTSPVIDAGDDLPLTLPALWRKRVQQHGEQILLACDDVRLAYAEADRRSGILARGLLAAGVCKGAHVGLLYPNGAEFLIGMLAAARIGAVVLPFSTLSKPDELRWLLANSDTGYLLAAAEFRSHRYADALTAALPELDLSKAPPLRGATAPWLRRAWFDGPVPERSHPGWSMGDLEALAGEIEETYLEAIEARVTPADRLAIIHTSGSTSNPKGVIHTHGAMIRHLGNICELRSYRSDDVLYSTAPWFWIAGFGFSLLGPIVAGARTVCSNATEPGNILDLLERERPTITTGYGAPLARLATDPSFETRDLSSIRRGTLYPIMAPELRPRDPELRHNIYAMTEFGGTLALGDNENDLPERYRGSFGRVVPGYETRIVDPESGEPCGTGEIGELWVRGPFLMEGYYGRPRSQTFEPEGWFRTGDLGRFDEDGFFYLKDRLGNMIKTSGANVSPREIEGVLGALTGGLQCHVFGLSDPQRGQIVAAVVVTEREDAIDEDRLKRELAEKLSSYKVPRRIFRIRSIEVPQFGSGKVDMRGLAALVRERWQK